MRVNRLGTVLTLNELYNEGIKWLKKSKLMIPALQQEQRQV